MALFQQTPEVKREREGGVLGEVQLNQPRYHYTYHALMDSSNSVGDICV